MIVITWLTHRHDPFWQLATFPWPLLVPLVVALRYGFFKGVCSIVLIGLFQFLIAEYNHEQLMDISGYSVWVGELVAVMIAGEFADAWFKNNQKMRLNLEYAEDRLQTFTRHYHLLRVSHDRLEIMLAGHQLSLRESLQSVGKLINSLPDRNIAGAARPILQLFSEYGGFQVAGFYCVDGKQINPDAIATVGEVGAVKFDDPLIHRLFERQQVASIAMNSASSVSHYQIAIPLLDHVDKIYAMILVEKVQFFSLREETLRLLTVMAGHIGDLLRHSVTNPVMDSQEFEQFYAQVWHIQSQAKRYDTSAQLIKIHSKAANLQVNRLLDYLRATRRGLDVYFDDAVNHSLTILMPLANEMDRQGFINRIEQWCMQSIGQSFEQLGIELTTQLSLPAMPEQLEQILKPRVNEPQFVEAYS
ncbi:PelD GGDEF domain-containing protein [Celerinatantimonas sp. MCCC 1A17872]|uniref:PelD GGDEF domain-containing protein n=1 Tax=Celerinatantimonas sp. MCCC 1A17872 TaxID=3177514 RepID=UPI0038C531DA